MRENLVPAHPASWWGEFELSGKQLTLRSNVGKGNRDFSWGEWGTRIEP